MAKDMGSINSGCDDGSLSHAINQRKHFTFFQVFNSVGQLYYGLDKHIEHMCVQLIIAYTNHDRN